MKSIIVIYGGIVLPPIYSLDDYAGSSHISLTTGFNKSHKLQSGLNTLPLKYPHIDVKWF